MTLPGDAERSTKRPRQEIPREQSQPAASSSCATADTSLQIPDPQTPKPARRLSPAEREGSIQKRQSPAEANTVLTIAELHNENEIASWTEDQKAPSTAKQKELFNMDLSGVVEVVDRPQSQKVSLDTLRTKKQWLNGSYSLRIVARIFEQTVSLDADWF